MTVSLDQPGAPKGPDQTPLRFVSVTDRFRMDCETPVSLYLKLVYEKSNAFILESVEHGSHSGRYSFIGWDPILTLSYQPDVFKVSGAVNYESHTDKPLDALRQLMARLDMLDEQDIPNARGGLVGHFSYDAIRLVEDIGPVKGESDPWIYLILPKVLLVFDHLQHVVSLIVHQEVGGDESQARALARGTLREVLTKIRVLSVANDPVAVDDPPVDWSQWTSNLDQEAFCAMVDRAKQHIVDGDIFQVVLSRAVRREFPGDPFAIYRVLRQINPSPYMFFLKQEGRVVVGGSPESLVKLDGGRLSTKPIAGTRPRGKTLDEDLALENDLLGDAKEIAEHVMLVDLGRNDLGRISRPGSVSVPRFMQIERYSHVMHIVSDVQGELRDDYGAIDALMSVFPAGTLSGAPKIRAMQIINDFEPEIRNLYGGAIGFVDFSGNLDSCIAIRTATVENGVVRVQAGAGIVADSVPIKEFEETTHKMMSVVTAVEYALRQSRRHR
ncbi:anthranilate synthase component I [Acanthopleuribacter pedis]|uniref:Anthranilate synthase component 1 n=1 Tax=Acanthopleuribacter pedis TaxID=442870 RepID=A0A8J7U4Y2_9BACT|nr:anthranilate synthase component I [Acanthopleuribacter pedis]MBO1319933.1 anthranilate synthase component I [Acanthopleuribacter pedis]